jgi:hypothetical protein
MTVAKKKESDIMCDQKQEENRDVEHTSQLPCSVPCSKCGSEDIYRRFYAEGENTNGYGPSREGKSTDFVNRDDAWLQPAKRDCLTNACRCCGYRWDAEPIKPND